MNIYSLPYQDDLIAHYQAFSDLDGFVLLESQDTLQGRYDILSAQPCDELLIAANACDWAEVLQRIKQKMVTKPACCDLPFQGGWIGFVAYDCKEAALGLTTHPSLVWPDMPWVDLKCYDWAIVTDHVLRQVYLLAPSEHRKVTMMERWYQHEVSTKVVDTPPLFRAVISRAQYQTSFDAIQEALYAGRAYQVNLTQPFLADYLGDPFAYYKILRQNNPVPFAAFLSLHSADILSFSPERFLSIDGGQMLASPIKGTIQRSVCPVVDQKLRETLLSCEKNRTENIMIVDLMRNDLSQFAQPGSVRVEALCALQSFAKVHHLVSHIHAQCQAGVLPMSAWLAMFPGGSITGAPKIEAMRIIHEQERHARGVYCGSIIYASYHGRIDSNIAIRTLIAKEQQLLLQAGGGIVIDSTAQDEYQECLTKIAAFTAIAAHV